MKLLANIPTFTPHQKTGCPWWFTNSNMCGPLSVVYTVEKFTSPLSGPFNGSAFKELCGIGLKDCEGVGLMLPQGQQNSFPGQYLSTEIGLNISLETALWSHRAQLGSLESFLARRSPLPARDRTGRRGSRAAATISLSWLWSLPHWSPVFCDTQTDEEEEEDDKNTCEEEEDDRHLPL